MRTALTAYFVLASMTVAQGSVDLAEILAPPPSADYADVAPSETVLNGAFTAHQYALWLARTASDAGGIEGVLVQEGFQRGYARSWSSLSSTKPSPGSSRYDWLVETVEEYGSANGAQARYAGVVSYTKAGADDYVREIETSIPRSFGAVIFSGYSYFVMFVKGNDVYIVRMESDLDDMTALTVHQAQAQFDLAPPNTIPPGQWQDPQASQPQGDHALDWIKLVLVSLKLSILGFVLVVRLALFILHIRRRAT